MTLKFVLFILFISTSLIAQQPPIKEINTENGLPSNTIRCFFKDSRGYFWIGTQTGLVKYDGKEFFILNENNGFPKGEVWSITEDGFGNLWFGIYGQGLVKYDRKHFTFYNKSNGLSGVKIRKVFYSSKWNKLLIGTENGLNIYNGLTFSLVGERPNIQEMNVLDITEWNDNIYTTVYSGNVFKVTQKENQSVSVENKYNHKGGEAFLASFGIDNQFLIATSTGFLKLNNKFEPLHDIISMPLFWDMKKRGK